MFDFISDLLTINTIFDLVKLFAIAFVGFYAFKSAAAFLNFVLELLAATFNTLKSGKARQALQTLLVKGFAALAPLLVIAPGAAVILFNALFMVAFDPNPSLLGTIGMQAFVVAVICRTAMVYLAHVKNLSTQLQPATEPPKQAATKDG